MPDFLFEYHYKDGRVVESAPVSFPGGVSFDPEGPPINEPSTGLVWQVRETASAEGYAAKVVLDEE